MNVPTREDAWKLLTEYVQSESLRSHCRAVEAAMRACAEKYGDDPELWGMAGLLHDFDYERFPNPERKPHEEHPAFGNKVLGEKGYPPEVTEAIMGHATYTGVPRASRMAKCLYACDELSGFVVAVGKIRPEGLNGLTPAKVKKYLKNKRFAEKVSREEIAEGIAELGVPEDEHIALVIGALRGVAEHLGLPSAR